MAKSFHTSNKRVHQSLDRYEIRWKTVSSFSLNMCKVFAGPQNCGVSVCRSHYRSEKEIAGAGSITQTDIGFDIESFILMDRPC